MADAIAETARLDMQSNDAGDVGESDVAKAAHNVLDGQVKRCQEPLASFCNSRLNVSGCKQAMSALSGAGSILITSFAVGARGVLVDKKMADESFIAINSVFGA